MVRLLVQPDMLRTSIVALAVALSVQASAPATLALVGGRIYVAPDAPPIDDGVVVVEKGRIARVGPRASTPVPSTARVIACKDLIVTAGLQNSHVHFTDPRWFDAAAQPATKLDAGTRE